MNILSLVDNATNMIAWISDCSMVATINKSHSPLKASPSDFRFQPNNNIILTYILDYINTSQQAEDDQQK